jgi:hypothetical protein
MPLSWPQRSGVVPKFWPLALDGRATELSAKAGSRPTRNDPENIVGMVAWLAEPEAAFVSGAMHTIDRASGPELQRVGQADRPGHKRSGRLLVVSRGSAASRRSRLFEQQ